MSHANHRNYYRLLHVQPDAPPQIIKSSYRTLMQKLKQHPDLGGENDNAALINEAYAVLTDPAKRAAYDRELAQTHTLSAVAGHRPASRSDTSVRAVRPTTPMHTRSGQTYTQTVHGMCAFCNTPYHASDSVDDVVMCAVCASPLFLTKNIQRDTTGKRSTLRIEREQAVVFFTHWPQQLGIPGKIRDLSPYGMCIHADGPLQNGQIIKIAGDTLHAVARVVNCRAPQQGATGVYGIGVEFITLHFQKGQGTFFSGDA